MRISIDTKALDYTLSLSDQALTIAQRDGRAVAVAPGELQNLLERLQLAARLYELAPTVCGPLRSAEQADEAAPPRAAAAPEPAHAPAPTVAPEPATEPTLAAASAPAAVPEPTRAVTAQAPAAAQEPAPATAAAEKAPAKPASPVVSKAAPAPQSDAGVEPPMAAKPASATPVVEEESDEAVTWRVHPTVVRRRRVGEPEPPPRVNAAIVKTTPPKPGRPALAAQATPGAKPQLAEDGSEKESKSKRRRRRRKLLEAAQAAAKPIPPWQQAARGRRPHERQPVVDTRSPADRVHKPRVSWKPGSPAVTHLRSSSRPMMAAVPTLRIPEPSPIPTEEPKPQRVVPPLPRTEGAPQLSDVMAHFLKHNGPSSLDEAVRYVRNQRIVPAAMNLRLSLIIALSKESYGFVRLDDGRYALESDVD